MGGDEAAPLLVYSNEKGGYKEHVTVFAILATPGCRGKEKDNIKVDEQKSTRKVVRRPNNVSGKVMRPNYAGISKENSLSKLKNNKNKKSKSPLVNNVIKKNDNNLPSKLSSKVNKKIKTKSKNSRSRRSIAKKNTNNVRKKQANIKKAPKVHSRLNPQLSKKRLKGNHGSNFPKDNTQRGHMVSNNNKEEVKRKIISNTNSKEKNIMKSINNRSGGIKKILSGKNSE